MRKELENPRSLFVIPADCSSQSLLDTLEELIVDCENNTKAGIGIRTVVDHSTQVANPSHPAAFPSTPRADIRSTLGFGASRWTAFSKVYDRNRCFFWRLLSERRNMDSKWDVCLALQVRGRWYRVYRRSHESWSRISCS